MRIFLKKYPFVFLVLVLAAVSLGLLFFATRSGSARIVFIDVGQGDATLVQTALGKNILIDTGAYSDIDQKISRYMGRSDRRIDMLILTHPDLDHVGGGLVLVDRYDIGMVGHSGLLAGSEVYQVLAAKINLKKIPARALEAGNIIHLEPDFSIEVLWPTEQTRSDNANDYSTVLRIQHQDSVVLITADAGKNTENDLVNVYGDYLQSDILKVGHHGSQTSTSNIFTKTVSPRYGIISAACDNRFGHPHLEVLSTLLSQSIDVLDTCSKGDIVFDFSDGSWVLQE